MDDNKWNYTNNEEYDWHHTHQQEPPTIKRTNPFATAALIMGILSLTMTFSGLSFILAPLGILFAVLSRKEEPMESPAKIGMGLSVAGLILGFIMVIIATFSLIQFTTNGTLQNNETYQEFYEEFMEEYDDSFEYLPHVGQ